MVSNDEIKFIAKNLNLEIEDINFEKLKEFFYNFDLDNIIDNKLILAEFSGKRLYHDGTFRFLITIEKNLLIINEDTDLVVKNFKLSLSKLLFNSEKNLFKIYEEKMLGYDFDNLILRDKSDANLFYRALQPFIQS